jgi:hypothetical protein
LAARDGVAAPIRVGTSESCAFSDLDTTGCTPAGNLAINWLLLGDGKEDDDDDDKNDDGYSE